MNNLNELIDRRGLLKYISPNVSGIYVLVVESLPYLREICELLPNAHITVATEFKDEQEDFDDLKVDWLAGNLTKLNIDENLFDIIIAEDALTFAPNPYDVTIYLNRRLKDTGFLITQFENVRFIGILESLRQGYFPVRERRLYAKTEVVRILNDALFKEISFTPDNKTAADIDEWLDFGFDNFNDELLVKNWIIKASKSKAEVAALKQFYTFEVRKELARILHRIEYDVERAENIERLKKFCEEYQIFDDYLYDFIDCVVVHREVFDFLRNEY